MSHRPSRRTLLRNTLSGAFVLASAGPGAAAPARVALVYVREAGCPYCREWDAKIGPIYGKTAEARRAPIREIDKRDVPASGLTLARPVRYTPTFLLTRDDIELGRIEGYPGEDFFWARLDRLLELLPPE